MNEEKMEAMSEFIDEETNPLNDEIDELYATLNERTKEITNIQKTIKKAINEYEKYDKDKCEKNAECLNTGSAKAVCGHQMYHAEKTYNIIKELETIKLTPHHHIGLKNK